MNPDILKHSRCANCGRRISHVRYGTPDGEFFGWRHIGNRFTGKGTCNNPSPEQDPLLTAKDGLRIANDNIAFWKKSAASWEQKATEWHDRAVFWRNKYFKRDKITPTNHA